jgi:hypothetical protein
MPAEFCADYKMRMLACLGANIATEKESVPSWQHNTPITQGENENKSSKKDKPELLGALASS